MGCRLDSKSNAVRKRIENHAFSDEKGDEYEGSKFGGFTDYFRRKKIKLQNLDVEMRNEGQAAECPQIFNGVVCHVNGYTQPSLNDLHKMVVQHGGGFLQYLDGKTMVTHIIAANLTPKKKEEFKRYRIVKPAWIVDSVQAGKLLPWDAYRVVDEGVGQKTLGFEHGNMISQTNRKVQSYREQSDASWYATQLSRTAKSGPQIPQKGTPGDDIDDDDEFPMPEITSSDERALDKVAGFDPDTTIAEPATSVSRDLLQVRTELETPPLSSPLQSPVEPKFRGPGSPSDGATVEPRPRQGSQEPNYSMRIVSESEVLQGVSPSKLANMTAEEHNALLLSDPKIRKSTVVNPDFLEQYYRESRLHHLSTWKAELKSQLQALAAEKSSQPAKTKKPEGQRRYIMHVDFDCFFAAVSLKKHPHLRDQPCVVAHGNGSGSEIASCNYPAREFGVKNGMWMRRAQDLCPELKILPYDFPGYETVSREFYHAVLATGGVVQSISIDEALVDVSAMCIAAGGKDGVTVREGTVHREQRRADELAQQLRKEVWDKTGCHVSVGVGGNILQAKVALRKAKPAGQYQLLPEDVLDFLGRLEVTSLPGVAWSIGGKLEGVGVTLVRDLRELNRERLVTSLGRKTGERLWDYARGIDRTEVGDQAVRKSVSAEVNWGVRFETPAQVDDFLHGLCGELHKRLAKERVRGSQLTLKVMRRAPDAPRDPPKHLGHGKCDTFHKSASLGVPTAAAEVIAKAAVAMLKSLHISPGELRGIGVQMQKLEPVRARLEGHAVADGSSQKRLPFTTGPPSRAAQESIDDDEDDVAVKTTPAILAAHRPSVPVPAVHPYTPNMKPLNVQGTQFVLPTQVDPDVLAELPDDVRARLAKRREPATGTDHAALHAPTSPVRVVPSRPSTAVEFPTQSQLDPTILDALPPDVRQEVLNHYRSPHSTRGGDQAMLPQSPRKTRIVPAAAPSHAPTKRRRRGGSTLFSRASRPGAGAGADTATLTQSHLFARASTPHRDLDTADGADGDDAGPDPAFLAALPADLRAEVVAQHRRGRLQRHGVTAGGPRRPRAGLHAGHVPAKTERRVLRLPARASAPTFTSARLRGLEALRSAVGMWHGAFAEEGPEEEDVEALGRYLQVVVGEERDVGTAVGVVRWLGWVVETEKQGAVDGWRRAVEQMQGAVDGAIRERGLGRVRW